MSPRKLTPGPLLIASHNPGKVREIAALLGPFGIEPIPAATLGLPEPDETEPSFAGNARLKARAAAAASGLIALADDSGLAVDALDGAPGIYSARWAGPTKDFTLAMTRVHAELQARGAPQPWAARFVCALSLAWPDGHDETFEGVVTGTLTWPLRGTRGFGYDPMFIAQGHAQTFGEMIPDEKHAISHRARAFALLVAACLAR